MTATVEQAVNPFDQFIRDLNRHDYYYAFSDDPRIHKKAEAEVEALIALARTLPPEAVRAAVAEVVPRQLLERDVEPWTAWFLGRVGV